MNPLTFTLYGKPRTKKNSQRPITAESKKGKKYTMILPSAAYEDYEAGCYNWATYTERVPISEGRKLFPGKCVLGGFDNNPGTLIDTGDDAQLEAKVRELIEENGYRGFTLGADCSIPNDIDDARVRVISDAAARFVNPNFGK